MNSLYCPLIVFFYNCIYLNSNLFNFLFRRCIPLNNISLILAFSAGLLSFLAPCVLPLIPVYISYLTGTAVNEAINDDHRLKVQCPNSEISANPFQIPK